MHVRFEILRAHLPTPLFDLAYVRQALDVKPAEDAALAVQLSRWERGGKIRRLRRGLYALAEKEPNTFALANRLVEPSYISGEYALSYYGLILDVAFDTTSACLIAPRRSMISTPYGRYSYRQVKVFDGFSRVEMAGEAVLFASPEKALVDTWHWLPGKWTRPRHEGMRYENLDQIDPALVTSWAEAFDSPRLLEAASLYLELRNSLLEA